MASDPDIDGLTLSNDGEPTLSRSYTLRLVGDWGGANFHRICSWLTQEFCDRAGPQSRTSIWSLRDGGMDAILQLESGEVHLAIVTPAALMKKVLTGEPPFLTAMPRLRALGTLPQNDRMVLAIHPKYGIETFEDLRSKKPALQIATSTNDGTNFIGFVASQFMSAHGISESELESWGGRYVTAQRPEQCTALVETGQADALLQEAIMTPWWRNLIDAKELSPLPAEPEALESLRLSLGMQTNPLPAGFWDNLPHDLPALDFSDFVILVRDDLPRVVGYVLAWCLVETRSLIEAQYKHLPPVRSPLSYPLDPRKMAMTPLPLHDGAREYYSRAGHL